MIVAYLPNMKGSPQTISKQNLALLADAAWIDLINPTREEEKLVEKAIHIDVPTREEMHEIEISSRLYKDNNDLFMTANMLAQFDTDEPKYDAVTFVLTDTHLLTIRYIEPLTFKMAAASVSKLTDSYFTATRIFLELIEASVDRLADILEIISKRLDDCSRQIFKNVNTNGHNNLDYQQLLVKIGINGELNAKVYESLVSFNRIIAFIIQKLGSSLDSEDQSRMTTSARDITSLSDQANFHSNKVNFLLDATLGMVSIEQNTIIKIFSVAAVIFLPPTLVASIYGMNFRFMPELSWRYGYILAIAFMLLSAWLPYKYFKRRKWL